MGLPRLREQRHGYGSQVREACPISQIVSTNIEHIAPKEGEGNSKNWKRPKSDEGPRKLFQNLPKNNFSEKN